MSHLQSNPFVFCPCCGADNKEVEKVRVWYNHNKQSGAWFRWTKCSVCGRTARAHYNTYLHHFIEPDYVFPAS